MIAVGERVRHYTSNATGTVQHNQLREPPVFRYVGDLAGWWHYVIFDDGFRCWCPAASLIPFVDIDDLIYAEML